MPFVQSDHPVLHMLSNVELIASIFSVPTINPNVDWDLSAFTGPESQEDGSLLCYNTNDPSIYIKTGMQWYPNHMNLTDFTYTVKLDAPDTGYVGLTSPNNWIELGGISGSLSGISIGYWGDRMTQYDTYIATKINPYVDNSSEPIVGTRSASGSGAYTGEPYVFASGLPVTIHNKLKIEFLESTGGSEAEFLIYRMQFQLS